MLYSTLVEIEIEVGVELGNNITVFPYYIIFQCFNTICPFPQEICAIFKTHAMLREMIINKVKPLSNLIFMPPTHLVLKLNTPGPPLHIQQQHQAAPQPQQQQQSHHQRHQLQCDHHFQAGSLP